VFDKKRILKNGLGAEATVLSAEYRSKVTSNELRDFDHELDVRPDNGEPAFQTMVRAKFWIIGLRPKRLDVLRVKYDPKSKEVVFDLEGDPRYDVDAMNAKTEAGKDDLADFKAKLIANGGMSAAGGGAKKDPIDQMERLVKLRDMGALTPEEFEEQKARILG
jgi:Short C-terminal domain